VLILAAALLLPAFMMQSDRPFRGAGLGPAAWPNVMLALLAGFAALWVVQELWAWRRNRGSDPAAAPSAGEDEEVYSYRKAALGLLLIVAFGWLLPIVGFPIATVAFIVLWCTLGGVRNPLVVVPVSLIGTVALLWLFMGAALMPLPRGRGALDQFSVGLLQALGIY
jgi:putative tricarboxylic transport membrane protein